MYDMIAFDLLKNCWRKVTDGRLEMGLLLTFVSRIGFVLIIIGVAHGRNTDSRSFCSSMKIPLLKVTKVDLK